MVTQRHDQNQQSNLISTASTSNRQQMDVVGAFAFFTCIGKACNGVSNVHLAKRKSDEALVAVRICHLDRADETPYSSLQNEIRNLRQLKHENVLPCFDSFAVGDVLFLVTPLYDFVFICTLFHKRLAILIKKNSPTLCIYFSGSVTDLIHARFQFGLPEAAIATILNDVVKAIKYLHSKDFLHRGIRCSHVFTSSDDRVCLGGLRHATNVLSGGKRSRTLHEFTPDFKTNLLWMAPEVLQQDLAGYGAKSDVYSLGITACEMANGFPPFSDMAHMQMLLEKLRGTTPRLLDSSTLPERTPPDAHGVFAEQKDRKFSHHFHNFTEMCLRTNPAERPHAADLLNHPVFKHVKKHKYNLRELLHPVRPIAISKDAIENTPNILKDPSPKKLDCIIGVEWTFE